MVTAGLMGIIVMVLAYKYLQVSVELFSPWAAAADRGGADHSMVTHLSFLSPPETHV